MKLTRDQAIKALALGRVSSAAPNELRLSGSWSRIRGTNWQTIDSLLEQAGGKESLGTFTVPPYCVVSKVFTASSSIGYHIYTWYLDRKAIEKVAGMSWDQAQTRNPDRDSGERQR